MVYVKASQPSPTYLVNRVGVGNGVLLACKKKKKIRNTVKKKKTLFIEDST